MDPGCCAFQGGHLTSRQFQPAIPVEIGVLQSNVYCLLQQQLLVGPSLANHCGLLSLDWMVVLPCMLCKGRLLQCSPLACILVLLHPHLEPPHCLPNVLLATAAGDLIYHLGPLLHRQGVLQAELPADRSDVFTDSFRVGKHHQWGSASFLQQWCLGDLHISPGRNR